MYYAFGFFFEQQKWALLFFFAAALGFLGRPNITMHVAAAVNFLA